MKRSTKVKLPKKTWAKVNDPDNPAWTEDMLGEPVLKRGQQGQEEVLSSEQVKKIHNPPHPGEFITDIFLEPHGISGRELALKLDVAPSTLSRILKGSSRVTPEMALRLSKAIGRSPESWLAMQDAHDLWVARKSVDLKKVMKLNLEMAG